MVVYGRRPTTFSVHEDDHVHDYDDVGSSGAPALGCGKRLCAYNALRFLRDRYLRSNERRQMPWDELRRALSGALTQAAAWCWDESAGAAQQTL